MAPNKARAKSRSPAPLWTPTTPSQFFPPSYFAAAAGVSYPLNPDDDGTPLQQDPCPFSSNASYERTRRRSRLGDLSLVEPNLLPTLSDTVERMTRPPSQVIYSPGVARAPSTSSQSSSAYSLRCDPAGQIPPMSGKQSFGRGAHLEQPPSARTSYPKSILKTHTTSDNHLSVRLAHSDDVRLPLDRTRKAGPSPIPIPPEPLPLESKTEHAHQMPTPPKPKTDSSLRSNRARSRTDPGTVSKGSPAVHTRNAQQPSGIPRRVGIPPSPATSRIPTAAQTPMCSSETDSLNASRCEKRRLFVTNAEIASSSSSESQTPLMRYAKPKLLARTDSQSSAESQLRPPRFGLGLGLSGVGESRSGKLSPGQRWTAKLAGDESMVRRATSPGHKQRRDGPKRRDRSPSQKARVDSIDGQRRRELLSQVHSDQSDSQPSSSEGSEDRGLVSDGSGNSLPSAFDDSGSEYSPGEGDGYTGRTLTRWETRQGQVRAKAAARSSRAGDSVRGDEQYTPRASSTPSFARQNKAQTRGYPAVAAHDDTFWGMESLSHASDEDASSIDETATRTAPERYSSELSRIMAVSSAAAARQREAFGITSSLDLEDHRADSSELPHADSDVSLVGDDRWQDECDELATGSLLQQLHRNRRVDGIGYTGHQSTGELSFSTSQTRSSVSQESIYSAPNSPIRRSSRGIVVPESPPVMPTVREQQWRAFERHVLDAYGEVEAQRQRFVWELTESEDSFVTQLQNMIGLFILPLRVKDTRMWVSGIPSDVTKLFDWLDDIVGTHAQLSSALAARQVVDHPRLQMLSDIFRSFIQRLEMYQPYLVKLEFTASVIDGLIHEGKNDFGDFITLQEASERCQGWTLEKYLIEPVNRLAHYPEVFRKLLQLTPKSHPDYMSTLSLFHAAKLAIRVLSEVKDREDAYEFVKMACSGIRGISSAHLVHRERRLLIRGSLTCVQVSNDEHLVPLGGRVDDHGPSPADACTGQRVRRADRLSKAISAWRGRSNSVKSTASTVVSFGTAPSSFDVHVQPVLGTPVVRVESEPVDVEVFVFTDIVLLASSLGSSGDAESDLEPLQGYGLSRVVSVLDEIDRRACITLDLAPLTACALEGGHVQPAGAVVTIALSQRARTGERVVLGDWLVPLQRSCQYTLRALSSPSATHALVNRAVLDTEAQKPVLSILAAGLPLPKSPSMQIEESERGMAGDSERQEREERGWWSKRFHEVFSELSRQEAVAS